MTIPAEAVEAALDAFSQAYDSADPDLGEQVLAALEAAAPSLMERAWEEGHDHCFHVEDPDNPNRNPYVRSAL